MSQTKIYKTMLELLVDIAMEGIDMGGVMPSAGISLPPALQSFSALFLSPEQRLTHMPIFSLE